MRITSIHTVGRMTVATVEDPKGLLVGDTLSDEHGQGFEVVGTVSACGHSSGRTIEVVVRRKATQ